MNKDNLTIRIAIKKPEHPETLTPKKKTFRYLLLPALFLPFLAFGLYQLITSKQMPEPAIGSSEVIPPPSLNEFPASADPKPDISTHPISTANVNRAKKMNTPLASLPEQPPAKQTLQNEPVDISTNHHSTIASTTKAADKKPIKQLSTTQLMHVLPPFLQRAQLSLGINNREPQNRLPAQITLSELPESRLFMFTELSGKAGETIHHRWKYEEQLIADIPIKVGADRWRCYSSKHLNKNYLGNWVVEITDDQGKVLYTQAFKLKG